MKHSIVVGQKAPDFKLMDQHDKEHSLSDYKNSWVLLYFYPKDDTPGCTKEACALRDDFHEFKDRNVKILGVSVDPVKSHAKFAEKYDLPFPILADVEKKVVELYKVWAKKKFMGREYMGTLRTSFLIDPKGVIRKVYQNVKPIDHAEEVLKDLESIQLDL